VIAVSDSPTPAVDDRFAASLRGFGLAGIISILAIVLTGNIIVWRILVLPVGAVLVLLWAWLSRTPWADLGYVRPRNWIGTVTLGIAFGCSFKLLMKAFVMPLLGADAINPAYHFLAGNTAMLPTAVWAMINAGFAEETVFRGYLFERSADCLAAA
jgi:membrane protease YdiL (CAAX protease family)